MDAVIRTTKNSNKAGQKICIPKTRFHGSDGSSSSSPTSSEDESPTAVAAYGQRKLLNNIIGKEKRAFVTFLAGAGDYVKGVIALRKSLISVKSKYGFLVAVTPDVPEDHRRQLRAHGCEVREIPLVRPDQAGSANFAMAYYVLNYSKLRIWEFDDYVKLVYLDGDMLCLENVDELLDLPAGSFYAVMDCFCECTWSHTIQHKLGWCQQEPKEELWVSSEPKPAPYFNAGMFVFEPSKRIFKDMMVKLNSWPVTPFAEQDFLNRYFEKSYVPIPNKYNLVLAMLWRHPKNVDISTVKIPHYCAKGSKPWKFEPEAEHMDLPEVKYLVDLWNGTYNAPVKLVSVKMRGRQS